MDHSLQITIFRQEENFLFVADTIKVCLFLKLQTGSFQFQLSTLTFFFVKVYLSLILPMIYVVVL